MDVTPSALAPTDFRSSLHAVVEEGPGVGATDRAAAGRTARPRFHPALPPGRRDGVRHRRSRCSRTRPATEGTFLLTLVPPARAGARGPRPRDVVFVLDRSGSMGGWKMVAARRALARMVDTLTEQDRFTVLRFRRRDRDAAGLRRRRAGGGDGSAALPGGGVPGTASRRAAARRWPSRSTWPSTSCSRDETGRGRDRILVLVTDGQVGNEDQILRTLGSAAEAIRVFTLGIDRAVNAAFLKRLADLGGGASELVESEERLDEVMDRVHRHIGTPVLTGLRLEPAGLRFMPGKRGAVAAAGPVRRDAADDPRPLPRPGDRRASPCKRATPPAACGPRRSPARRRAESGGRRGVGAAGCASWRTATSSAAATGRAGKGDRGAVVAVRRAVPVHGVRGGGPERGGERRAGRCMASCSRWSSRRGGRSRGDGRWPGACRGRPPAPMRRGVGWLSAGGIPLLTWKCGSVASPVGAKKSRTLSVDPRMRPMSAAGAPATRPRPAATPARPVRRQEGQGEDAAGRQP